jgi:hypothetical protein
MTYVRPDQVLPRTYITFVSQSVLRNKHYYISKIGMDKDFCKRESKEKIKHIPSAPNVHAERAHEEL